MASYEQYLVVSDMDGTLLGADAAVSEKNRAAIARFQQEGGLFTIASGRNPNSLTEFVRALHIDAPVICQNGAMLYDFKENRAHARSFLSADAADLTEAVFKHHPEVSIEIHTDSGVYGCHPNEQSAFRLTIEEITVLPFEHLNEVPQPWIKVVFWLPAAGIPGFLPFLQARNRDRFHLMRTHEFACEILPVGADKGSLLSVLRERYPDRKIVACGDNENDVKMLQNADKSFCPANAFECAENAADCKLPQDCDHDFIAAVIERLADL